MRSSGALAPLVRSLDLSSTQLDLALNTHAGEGLGRHARAVRGWTGAGTLGRVVATGKRSRPAVGVRLARSHPHPKDIADADAGHTLSAQKD